MLSVYGVLTENEDKEFCIDDIPVADLLGKYLGKEVSVSITDTSTINENEEE